MYTTPPWSLTTRTTSAITAAMEESTDVQSRKKRPRRARDISRQSPFKLSMLRRHAPTHSNGLPRTWASRRSQLHQSPEYLITPPSFRRKRQGRLILPPPIAAQIALEISRGTIRQLRQTPL